MTGRGVFVTGTLSPVNILSFTITVPLIKTASQNKYPPFFGMTKTSPGTKSSDNNSIISPDFPNTFTILDFAIILRSVIRYCLIW